MATWLALSLSGLLRYHAAVNDPSEDDSDPREALVAATRRFRRAEAGYARAREEVIEALIRALKSGMPPTEATELSPFKVPTVRKFAREHAVPPAPRGRKSKQE
jgi:hypothetical protein